MAAVRINVKCANKQRELEISDKAIDELIGGSSQHRVDVASEWIREHFKLIVQRSLITSLIDEYVKDNIE